MKSAWCLLILFLSAIGANAQENGKVYLLEVTEPTQEKSNVIVTAEAYQSLQAEMAAKNRLLPKAIELATKEWKENHSASGAFPQSTAELGTVKSLGMFSDKAKAGQAMKDINSSAPKDEKKKLSSAEKQLQVLQSQLSKITVSVDTLPQRSGLQARINILQDSVAAKKKKDAELAANLAIAREMFRSKLQELLAGNTAATQKAGDHRDESGQVPAPKSN